MKTKVVIIGATSLTGSLVGAGTGAWTANAIQVRRYNDPDWANLDPAFIGLFTALFAIASLDLGRWVAALRSGNEEVHKASNWLVGVTKALVRIATAALGLRLGYEAGMWTALIWDTWGSTAQYAAEAHLEFSNVWIGAACVWGGGLSLLGYRVARRMAPVASFTGAYLALHAVPYVSPAVADLYWGPFPNSDVHSFVLGVAHFLTTCLLVLAFSTAGYWLGRKLERRFSAIGRRLWPVSARASVSS
jgi:hypothetical protein